MRPSVMPTDPSHGMPLTRRLTIGFLLLGAIAFLGFSRGLPAFFQSPTTAFIKQTNQPVRVYPGVTGVFFILPDGSLWRWGQTGGQAFKRASKPEQVGTNCHWARAYAANNHCLGIATNDTLWEWGWCTGTIQTQPTQVDTQQDWISIAPGDIHSAALKRDGTIWAWGDNAVGQLGTPGLPTQTKPVQVGTNCDWTKIDCGQGSYDCALRKDGTLWFWGQTPWNLGSIQRYPVQVGTETNWTDFPATGFIKNQAGNVLFTPFLSTPQCPLQFTNWIDGRFASGYGGLYKIQTNGTLWRAMINSGSPGPVLGKWTQVGSRSDWISLWGGSNLIGLTADNTLWAWGTDQGHEPEPRDIPSKFMLLKLRLGLNIGSATIVQTYDTIKKPQPLLRFVLTEKIPIK